MRKLFIKILIYLLEKDLLEVKRATMTEEQENKMFAQIWDLPTFRNYILDRNTKIVYNLAGGDGINPEPRDKYLMKLGQRVEILILANKAKSAYNRRLALAKEKNPK